MNKDGKAPSPMAAFENFLGKLLNVRKDELDQAMLAEKREKKKRPKPEKDEWPARSAPLKERNP